MPSTDSGRGSHINSGYAGSVSNGEPVVKASYGSAFEERARKAGGRAPEKSQQQSTTDRMLYAEEVLKRENEASGGIYADFIRRRNGPSSYENGETVRAKSDLIDYYRDEFDAVLMNPRERIMAIEEVGAKKLYDRYYKGKCSFG